MHCNVCACKACLCMQVVPDDSHLGVDALLKEIWIEKQCWDVPKFYATDNVAKDRYLVAETFEDIQKFRQDRGLAEQPAPEILQDVYHARERVTRMLSRSHPDHLNALGAARKVFNRLAQHCCSFMLSLL